MLDGELDLAAEFELEAAIEHAVATTAATIVIDLDQVSFLDAAGLGLIARYALADTHRDRIRVTRGSRAVQHVFEMTGLGDRLQVL
jgi:anti-sigma B factor antagonist